MIPMRDIINTVLMLDESAPRKPRSPTPAKQFIAAAKADKRTRFCSFGTDGRNTVIASWLEGSGGLVPFLTSLADQFGVTLDLMVEVYGLHDGGKLVPYYERNGFTIQGSDFPDDFDFAGMPTSDEFSKLQGIVSMTRKPRQPSPCAPSSTRFRGWRCLLTDPEPVAK